MRKRGIQRKKETGMGIERGNRELCTKVEGGRGLSLDGEKKGEEREGGILRKKERDEGLVW